MFYTAPHFFGNRGCIKSCEADSIEYHIGCSCHTGGLVLGSTYPTDTILRPGLSVSLLFFFFFFFWQENGSKQESDSCYNLATFS